MASQKNNQTFTWILCPPTAQKKRDHLINLKPYHVLGQSFVNNSSLILPNNFPSDPSSAEPPKATSINTTACPFSIASITAGSGDAGNDPLPLAMFQLVMIAVGLDNYVFGL